MDSLHFTEFTESETQEPADLQFLERVYNSPPALAQECKSFKWKIQLIGNVKILLSYYKLCEMTCVTYFDYSLSFLYRITSTI